VNEELSYEQVVGDFIGAEGDGNDAKWKQSAYAFLLLEKMCAPIGQVSHDTGRNPKYLKQLATTFLAFPEEGDRAQDMCFSLHLHCALATTETPEYWLDESVRHAYTVCELLRVMKGKTPKPTPLEVAEKAWKKIEKVLESNDEGSIYIREQIEGLI